MKYIKVILLFKLFLSINNLTAQSLENNLIEVEIDGLNNDTIQIMYYSLLNPDSVINDVIVTQGNKFLYQPLIHNPCALAIVPKKSYFKRNNGSNYMPQSKFIELIYLPNEKIKIKGELSEYYLDYKISGSLINEEYANLRSTYKTEAIRNCAINLQINSLQGIEHSKEYELQLFDERNSLGQLFLEKKLIL